MENSDPFTEGAAAAPEEKKKAGGPSSWLLIVIALVNFLALAGIGAYLVFLQPTHTTIVQAQPAAGEGAEGEGAAGGDAGVAEEDLGDKGPLMAIDPIVTNLAEPDSEHYLKVSIQLRITSEPAIEEVEAFMVPIRSQILMFLSSLSVVDISGADNKRAIQEQVKRIANETLEVTRISRVYFTEFVIQ